MNFRGVTKSYSVTFGAAEPNSLSAKRNEDTKKKLQVMFIPRKQVMDILSFLSGCHGNRKFLGNIYFSLIKVMLHSMTASYLLYFTKCM